MVTTDSCVSDDDAYALRKNPHLKSQNVLIRWHLDTARRKRPRTSETPRTIRTNTISSVGEDSTDTPSPLSKYADIGNSVVPDALQSQSLHTSPTESNSKHGNPTVASSALEAMV